MTALAEMTATTEVSPPPTTEQTALERLARFAEREALAAPDERTRNIRQIVLALVQAALATEVRAQQSDDRCDCPSPPAPLRFASGAIVPPGEGRSRENTGSVNGVTLPDSVPGRGPDSVPKNGVNNGSNTR